MTDVLHIEWRTGRMDINLRSFFPCPAAKYNKLLKVIRMDFEHEWEDIQTLKEFFTEMVQAKDEEWKEWKEESGRMAERAAKKAKKDKEWFVKYAEQITRYQKER